MTRGQAANSKAAGSSARQAISHSIPGAADLPVGGDVVLAPSSEPAQRRGCAPNRRAAARRYQVETGGADLPVGPVGSPDLPVGPDAWSACRQAEQRVPAGFVGREQVRKEREALHGLRPKTATAGKVEQNGASPGDAAGQKTLTRPGLSTQQRRVAQLVARGLSDCEIAARLGLSENTVGAYLQLVFKKFRVHSRVGLATCFIALSGTNGLCGGNSSLDQLDTNVCIAGKIWA